MALGTITAQVVDPHGQATATVVGDVKMTVTNIVGDSSYPGGGSPVTPAQLGLSTIVASQSEQVASTGTNCAATGAQYLIATGKLICFASTGVEVAGAVNLSGITWQVLAFGY